MIVQPQPSPLPLNVSLLILFSSHCWTIYWAKGPISTHTSGAVVGVTVPDARCPGFKCMFVLKCSVRIKCTKVKRSINLFVWYPVAQLDELCFWIERLFVQTQARSSRRWCGVGGSDGRMSWKCWRAWPDLTWDEGGNTQASAPPGSGQMNKEGYGTGRESIDLVLHP